MRKGAGCSVAAFMTVFITVVYFVAYLYTPYNGDDLYQLGVFDDGGVHGGSRKWHVWGDMLRWVWAHWNSVNGRMSDIMHYFFLGALPRWSNALINACSVGGMFWLAVMLVRMAGGGFGRMKAVALVGALAFVLPWWDSTMCYAVVRNYVLGSVAVMLWLYLFFYMGMSWRGWTAALSVVYSFVAGGMHEAASPPLVCGLAVWVAVSHGLSGITRNGKWMLGAFVCGAAWTACSPAMWDRVSSGAEPDDPLLWLLLKSVPVVAAMSAAMLVMLSRKGWRDRLVSACRTCWVVFPVAALASSVVCAAGGIVGRSGWFAEIYALIAVFTWPGWNGVRVGRVCGNAVVWCVTLAVCAHFLYFMVWQVKMGGEHSDVIDMYRRSDDGQVYYDATRDDDAPWWLLNRARGVPDADDVYQNYTIALYYGDAGRRLAVLPSCLEGLSPGTVPDGGMALDGGDMVVWRRPEGTRTVTYYGGKAWIDIADIGGVEYVVVPFRSGGSDLYYVTRRVLDPGDR